MDEELQVEVNSEEAAARLREEFEELLARVNGDMMFQSMVPSDPISVEVAVANAERSIEAHLGEFADNEALQKLGPEIKMRFRKSIEQQAGMPGV